jgi:hypothetical protein
MFNSRVKIVYILLINDVHDTVFVRIPREFFCFRFLVNPIELIVIM